MDQLNTPTVLIYAAADGLRVRSEYGTTTPVTDVVDAAARCPVVAIPVGLIY